VGARHSTAADKGTYYLAHCFSSMFVIYCAYFQSEIIISQIHIFT
jgi:hypothetical protein